MNNNDPRSMNSNNNPRLIEEALKKKQKKEDNATLGDIKRSLDKIEKELHILNTDGLRIRIIDSSKDGGSFSKVTLQPMVWPNH